MIRTSSFLWDDQPDIEQELMLHLHLREHRYDPERASLHTFISRIIDNKIRNLIESRHAECRDWNLGRASLNQQFVDDEGNLQEWLDSITHSDLWDGPTRESRQHAEHELRMDVAAALAKLSRSQLALCHCLMLHSVAEASRILGLPRSTIYDQIHKIREVFSALDLKNHR